MRLNSDRERRDLDALYRVEDNHLVLLEVESYVDVIFDWEGANGDLDASKLVVFARESNLIGFSFT